MKLLLNVMLILAFTPYWSGVAPCHLSMSVVSGDEFASVNVSNIYLNIT